MSEFEFKQPCLLWPRENRLTQEQQSFTISALGAVDSGDVDTLRRLADDTLSPHYIPLPEVVEGDGTTLLHVAMAKRNKDCIKYLVQCGCSITTGNSSKETPIHVACMMNNVDGLRAVLEIVDDVDLERKDMWGRTPLLKAMVYNRDAMVNFLLDLGVNVNAQDEDGLSMVHLAVSHCKLDLLYRLHSLGADINSHNHKKRPPLYVATVVSSPHLVKGLLKLGASAVSKHSHQPPILQIIGKVIQSYENHCSNISDSERVLHLMLAAHGFPIDSDELDVFRRLLKKEPRFLPLSHKMHICSDSPYENCSMRKALEKTRDRSSRRQNSLGGQSLDRSPPGTPISLFNLARRSARMALMASGKNVVWAVDRLTVVPPAVKKILLLKDCERKLPPAYLNLILKFETGTTLAN